MVSNLDLQKWQAATNGINEAGQHDLSGEEWSALVVLNGYLQSGNFESDESLNALTLLKNNLSRHSNNQILQVHLQSFIALCEQYFPNKSETAQPQVPPPPPFKMNLQSQPQTYGGKPSEDILNWQKAVQGVEAGKNNLSSEELSAFNSLKELANNGNFRSSESGGNIQILKNALPRHSTHRLLQIHLKNFIVLCEKYFQTNQQTISPKTEQSPVTTKDTDKTKGGSNKVLFFIIVALVVSYLVYSHWDTVKDVIGIKPTGTDSISAENKATADLGQTAAISAQQQSNTASRITSVITPWTRFTNTFVVGNGGNYVISFTDGNLYFRDYEKDTLILKNVKEINGTESSFFAIKNDGSLWAWGDNSVGQLGDNTGINKTVPVKILDNVRDINIVNSSIFAIKNDGSLWAWGYNQSGGLGVGDRDNRYKPEKTTLENVSYIYNLVVITDSGDEYTLFTGKPNLVGKYDYNVSVSDFKLKPKGELYRNNDLITSNVFFMGGLYTYSYITKNGDLYSCGKAPIGDGSNIPRKDPVLVLQNVIQSDPDKHYALCADGKLYAIDTKNTFRYEAVTSNVYLLTPTGYYTNDGSLCTFDGNVILKDVALPKIKYEIKPPAEQNSTTLQASAVDINQVQQNTTQQVNPNSSASSLSSALSTRLLTEDDLRNFSRTELRILRNEIYARHGYIFKSQDLRDYFSTKDWYHPQYNDVSSLLNTIEKKNVVFIQRHE